MRTLSFDPVTQKWVRFHALADGRFVVETLYDAQDMVDMAARIRREQPSGWKGDMHHVGVIPMPMHTQMRKEGSIQDPKALRAFFQNFSKLGTKRGF